LVIVASFAVILYAMAQTIKTAFTVHGTK